MSSGDWWALALAMFSGLVGAAIGLLALGTWIDDRRARRDEQN